MDYRFPKWKDASWNSFERQAERYAVLRPYLGTGLVGAEIGVYKGGFGEFLLPHCAKLYLVDPWYRAGGFWPTETPGDSRVATVIGILAAYKAEIEAGRVEVVVDYAETFLCGVPDGAFDFIYLDASHKYDSTARELALAHRKLKPGGRIFGDDYDADPASKQHGVWRAVNEFAAAAGGELFLDAKRQWGMRFPQAGAAAAPPPPAAVAAVAAGDPDQRPGGGDPDQRPGGGDPDRRPGGGDPDQRPGGAQARRPADAPGLALPGYDLEDAPAAVVDHPGMTSRREKAMLYRLAKSHYAGEGIIVDAGLFLGASTNAFAWGLKAGPALDRVAGGFRPIVSYDIALWAAGMNRHLKTPAVRRALRGREMRAGQSFLPVLKRLLAPHRELIDFRIGDIVETARADRPIEIAFYDCLKTAERDAAAFRAFAPHYLPGRTIVVQQDYFFESAPDLKIRQELLAPYFSYLGAESTSAVFRLEKPLPEAYFREDPVDALGLEEKVALLRQAAGRAADPKFRLYAELAAVDFLAEAGAPDRARDQLSDLLRDAPARVEEAYGKRMTRVLAALQDRIAG